MTEASERWGAYGTAAVLTPILMLTAGIMAMPFITYFGGFAAMPPLSEMLLVAIVGLPLSVVLGLPLYALSLPFAWRLARGTPARRAGLTFAGFGLIAAVTALPLWFAASLLMSGEAAGAFPPAVFLTLMGCLYAPLYGAVFGRIFAASLRAARRRNALMTSKGDPS